MRLIRKITVVAGADRARFPGMVAASTLSMTSVFLDCAWAFERASVVAGGAS